MWKYDPKLIKSEKIITWIICIVVGITSSLALILEACSNHNELFSTIIFCLFILLICFLTALFTTLSPNRNSKKAWQDIIKEFSLIENNYTEFTYTLQDCYKNRKMLNEIIDILKYNENNSDFFISIVGNAVIAHCIFNADCSMTNLLMRVINKMGGKFYLFFNNEKKIFFCVLDSNKNEIYKKEIENFSELKEEILINDYL